MTPAARILALAQLTLQDPRRAAGVLLAQGVPQAARMMGLFFVAVVSAILASLQVAAMQGPADPLLTAMTASPLQAAVLQALILILSVILIHAIGRAFGGTGCFPDALLIMVWLQFLLLGAQLLQLAADLFAPALAGIIGILALATFLWLLTAFIAELHGFRSRGMVFLGVIGTMLGMGVIIATAIILALGPEVLLLHV
jgi:Yip1 domain